MCCLSPLGLLPQATISLGGLETETYFSVLEAGRSEGKARVSGSGESPFLGFRLLIAHCGKKKVRGAWVGG